MHKTISEDEWLYDHQVCFAIYSKLFIHYVVYIYLIYNVSYFLLAFEVHDEKFKENRRSF